MFLRASRVCLGAAARPQRRWRWLGGACSIFADAPAPHVTPLSVERNTLEKAGARRGPQVAAARTGWGRDWMSAGARWNVKGIAMERWSGREMSCQTARFQRFAKSLPSLRGYAFRSIMHRYTICTAQGEKPNKHETHAVGTDQELHKLPESSTRRP